MKRQLLFRKGQTEDIFSDFLISLVLIVITIGVISFMESGREAAVEIRQGADIAKVYGIDVITTMRAPIPPNYIEESKWWRTDTEITLGEMLGIIADKNESANPWVFSKEPFGKDTGFAMTDDSGRCTQNFYNLLESKFPFVWQLSLYNEQGNEIFRCTPLYANTKIFVKNDSEVIVGGGFRSCKLIRINIPTEQGNTTAAEVGLCP